MENKREICFLIISDIQENIQNVKKLKEWVLSSNIKYDYVICCGDIVKNASNKQENKEKSAQYELIIKSIIEELEAIAGNVIYVPGNKDPGTLFKENPPSLTANSINLHKKYIKISTELVICGIGGSIPIIGGGFFNNNTIYYQSIYFKGVKVEGYPYNFPKVNNNYEKSDEMIEKDLNEVIKKVKKEEPNAKIILLSHNGPFFALTSTKVQDSKYIYTGSVKLGDLFFENENIILNIHGHSNEGRGIINVMKDKRVINPGDLNSGYFATLIIKKNLNNDWDVESSSLNVL